MRVVIQYLSVDQLYPLPFICILALSAPPIANGKQSAQPWTPVKTLLTCYVFYAICLFAKS